MNKTRIAALLIGVGLVAAACSSSSDTPATTTEATGAVVISPASLAAEEQTSDGTTIVVRTVTLPSNGFIAVHADANGSPGAVIGHSGLLGAGENTDVAITLDEALTASGVVWPMVHIDMDGDGEYTFAPPDDAVDLPGTTEDGNVAVISVQINL
jgi:hypothetical protein